MNAGIRWANLRNSRWILFGKNRDFFGRQQFNRAGCAVGEYAGIRGGIELLP